MNINRSNYNISVYLLPEAILTVILGGLIYIIFRTDSLLMFRWFEQLQISDYVYKIRESGIFSFLGYNKTIINTVPGGLWAFSYTAFILLIWNMKITSHNIIYFIFIPAAGIVSEIFQLTGTIRGTFDYIDIISYALGAGLPLLIHIRKIKFNLL